MKRTKVKEIQYAKSQSYRGLPKKTKSVKIINQELTWFFDLVDQRILELVKGEEFSNFNELVLPSLENAFENPFAHVLEKTNYSNIDRLMLVMCLAVETQPEQLTNRLRSDHKSYRVKFAEFGGYIDSVFGQFIPTVQTALFLLYGDNKDECITSKQYLFKKSYLKQEGIITYETMKLASLDGADLNLIPKLASEYLHYFESGERPRPDFGRNFPATWVSTNLDWNQLVLSEQTEEHIKEVMRWVEHGKDLIEFNSQFNPSYSCLFFGPPGTGKSLTAKLIGKKYSKDVFRVDLSMVVSKYVGETEKNLSYLFDRAEGKDWILFFDEADALFSKRTDVGNANDKWANLEVSYLLQRMEEHRGLTILATNLPDNIDRAMTRRFQSVVFFPAPKAEQRASLWKKLLPQPFEYANNISLEKLSKYDLSGANIANILKDSCLGAMVLGTKELNVDLISRSIKKEFSKEKRTP